MGLYEKMFSIMTESDGLKKDLNVGSGNNSYRAVGEKEVLNMLKPLFKKYKLVVFPIDGDISEQNSTFEATYKGDTTTKTRNVTQLKVNFKIVDIETGETETLVGFGNGADSQDKGSGKAFTYAYKTMLSKTFMLFSGEDADNTHSDDLGKLDKVVHIITKDEAKNLLEVANSKGVTAATVTKQLLAKFKLSLPSQLNKEQYDIMIKGYENMKKATK